MNNRLVSIAIISMFKNISMCTPYVATEPVKQVVVVPSLSEPQEDNSVLVAIVVSVILTIFVLCLFQTITIGCVLTMIKISKKPKPVKKTVEGVSLLKYDR